MLGGLAAFVVFMLSALGVIGASSTGGRVKVPGTGTLRLPAGDFGVYYEEQVKTDGNETFNAPDDLRVKFAGTGDAPDLRLRPAGLGGVQIETEYTSSEQIGSITVTRPGRYRVRTASSDAANRPTVTVGEQGYKSFLRGGLYAAYVMGGAIVLALLVAGVRRLRSA